MKKLGISLVAVLVGLPTIARADLAQLTKANIATNTNVATTSFVGGAHDALVDAINADRTQINTNTSDIAGKQAQLVNDAQTAANIAGPVKTTVAAAATASDTALVTEKAVRTAVDDAITAATYDDTALAGRVTTLEGTVSGKADSATTLAGYGITDAYTKTETDSAISTAVSGKADSATTLAGYGITDAYTKTETDTAITNGAVQTVAAGTTNGTISVDGGADVTVYDDTALAGRVSTLETASSATKGFAVYGTWGQPTTATGHVDVVNSSTLNP